MHGKLPILGFRFTQRSTLHAPHSTLIYITDMKTIDDSEVPYAENADTLVVNSLRQKKTHHSHQLLDDAVAFARRTQARRTLLIHPSHEIGLHAEVNRMLPDDIQLAYDGQVIEV